MSAATGKAKSEEFDDDLVAIERFLAGDAPAFESLYRKYYDKVFAIAKGVLLDSEEAADAVQEVFTLVYRHLRRFDRRSRFSTWLFRVAVNRSIQQARKIKHKARHVPLDEAIGKEADDDDRRASDDPRIQEALAKIPPSDRAILTLFYWDELSLQEIGASMGCSVNAAKTRLYRARERFRTAYEEAST